MNIFKAISEFFKRGFRSTPKLPASEEKTTRIGGLKSYEKANIKEEIKINPNLSYTDRITNYINEAKTNPNVFKALSSWDREKLLVGAILEEKGASEELMKLFNNTSLISCDPKYFESQLNQDFTSFVVPESFYEATLEGIKNRMDFLRNQIFVSLDKNSYKTNVKFVENQPFTVAPHDRGQSKAEQTIEVNENGEAKFTFNLDTTNNSTGKVTENHRHLSRKNGKDDKLIETRKGYERLSDYSYSIERRGDKAIVIIDDTISGKHSPELYEQIAPKSFLDTEKGLGWFDQNDNARRLFEGKISVKELNEELNKKGLGIDSQKGIEPND